MSTRIFGSGIRRREDPRLITGSATYTDDITLPGMVHAAMLRSEHAHAKITRIDTSKAAGAPGVVAVYTGADIEGALAPMPCAWLLPDSDLKIAAYPCIAKDVVRYTGDIVATVVAETPYQAHDALALIEVDYEPLEVVIDPEAAHDDGAPQLHDDIEGNQAFHWTVAGGGDVDEAFAEAEANGVVLKERILQQRLIPNAMETRGALAQYNQATGELTLWNTTQNPHIVRFLCSVVTGVPEDKLRVIAPEVGGGFGSKIAAYPADFITVFCSKTLGRPVKWTETRSENYQATTHGRDHVQDVELAATKDGKITGLRCTVHAGMGAYLSTAAPGIPTILHGLMLSGVYDIPAIKEDVYGVYTNGVPVEAYRGAGRPEATFMLERMVDILAGELGMDPADVRRKNFIPKFDDGHTVVTTLNYDSGDYPGALEKLLDHTGYADLRARQQAGPSNGKHLGLGLSTYVEICGLGPSQVAGAIGFQGGLWESAIVRFHPTGKVHVFIGASPHGQGEETTFAQIVASEIGVDAGDVKVVHGDTDATPMGWGTYGSRTTAVGGAALALAVRKIREKAKVLAAHLLEASVDDMEYEDGKFFVKGSPDKAKTIQDIALMANVAWNLPEGMEGGLEATTFYDPPNFVFPYGAHLAVVEVDASTGQVDLTGYTALDDCGPQINPTIVEGQVHGGVVQGVGQALWEGASYDENGQLATGSMLDYALPRADLLPDIDVISTVTPSPHHPLGVKGIGEAGTIASTAAVYNAVMDALRPLGVKRIDMPFTPERVWQAIQDAKGN
ncbi:MAG: molybdopterin-dependent oxidoreductase [Acidobacteria bacterium]|nr:molybdopterin-dependent oxidoreductase [Acidobacteriota bacterium]MYD70596.1 molybdopterin-dependent oxidoreductase [Acidobacteriota bacterium]MYJ03229.1 molybdopterin-dependent oxidoreductase [Acidobacteriota bacterium]